MDKISRIKKLLADIGLPVAQQSNICALTVLGMAGLKKTAKWTKATNEWVRIHDIILFVNNNYEVNYAENSRETFRKKALHHFRNAAIVEDNGEATNSPNYRWRLTDEFVEIIRKINTSNTQLELFKCNHERLIDTYSSKREFNKIPVKINGLSFSFSGGKHNQLQKAIIENFASRFAPNSECLYVGDTTQKDLVKLEDKLTEIGFEVTFHDKMPDIILYSDEKKWLYFIEAVTSVGPMEPKRVKEIMEMTKNVKVKKIFITAFLDFKTYKKFSEQLAWETEVWIAEIPDHMIHLNGHKFLG
jgi:hypothetical protein